MTEAEQSSLRAALERDVQRWKERHPENITDASVRLDEDSCQFYTTEAEILVFRMPRKELYRLQVAYAAYQYLIGMVSGIEPVFYDLIVKARDIVPPARLYDLEFPFRLKADEVQWFQWFGKTFMDLPYRSTHAYWHKRMFNLEHLTIYRDEERSR